MLWLQKVQQDRHLLHPTGAYCLGSARGTGSVVPQLFQFLANCVLIEVVAGALRTVDQESEQLPGVGADARCVHYFVEGRRRAIG